MSPHRAQTTGARNASSLKRACPPWCVSPHGLHEGEDDWLHQSEPRLLDDRLAARLCMSVDPHSGLQDGPYVVIGSREYTAGEVRKLGLGLVALADDAEAPTRPGSA